MLLAVATQMLPLLALVGFENVQKNAIYHRGAGNGRWPVSAGGREELESANMANRRDQRHTFEGSRGGDKPEEEQQLRATGQRARRETTPCYRPVSAGGREVLESANMANRRDQRPTFEGSRGGDKPEEKQQLRATGQRARRATTPCYCPVSAGGREDLESANMANRRDQRPTFEGSRGVRYQNIANRRDERPTFVKNSRLASTVC